MRTQTDNLSCESKPQLAPKSFKRLAYPQPGGAHAKFAQAQYVNSTRLKPILLKPMRLNTRPLKTRALKTRRSQTGFSFVEVLVAAVLFSIGIAGVISLQLFTMSSSQIAGNRAQALMLMSDIVERIRSNPEGGILALYNFNGSVNTPATQCDNTVCTSDELAQFDLWQWQNKLTDMSTLPNAGGRVQYHSDGSYTIEVTWVDLEAQQTENKSIMQRVYFFSQEEIALMSPP